MAFNDLPASIQQAIQTGFLERRFQRALEARLGFRAVATKEPFMASIGESITKTRPGLLPAVTTPMTPAQVTDITSGLTPANLSAEQYTLAVAQYAQPMYLNVATAKVAIDDLFLQNAEKLGEQARRSIDMLARNALFDVYMGGNTRVTTTLGSPATTVKVDDVRGFFAAWTSQNVPAAISGSNTLTVTIGSNVYTLTGCIADGTAPANLNPWMSLLTFSGTGSNTSTAPSGYSGTLTLSSNVSVSDGTSGNAVTASVAPSIFRPTNASSNKQETTSANISISNDLNAGRLTMNMILQAKDQLAANAVAGPAETGNYILYADPQHLSGLYNDPAFQMFFRGKPDSPEYKRGVVTEQLGVTIVENNLNPQQVTASGILRRAMLCGEGALVEGQFTPQAAAAAANVDDASMMVMIDGVAHVVREPIDALKQVVTQAWYWIGGFVAPTDILTNTSTIPSASNAAWKRAAVLESY